MNWKKPLELGGVLKSFGSVKKIRDKFLKRENERAHQKFIFEWNQISRIFTDMSCWGRLQSINNRCLNTQRNAIKN